MHRHRFVPLLLVPVALAATAFFFWRGQPRAVEIGHVRIGPAAELVYATGFVEAEHPVSVASRLTAPDAEVLVAEGRIRLERFGFVFQFHFLLPEFSALDNVMLPMRRLGRLGRAGASARARELLATMGLDDKRMKSPDRLSGGERQRVAIARALANDSAIILGDEPTGNLDSVNTASVIEIFRSLAHRDGRAVVCVTHDENVAAAADIRVSMLDGRVVEVARA